MKNKYLAFFFIFALTLTGIGLAKFNRATEPSKIGLKLYWFIPDGLRAEPEVFKIYEWARQGELPNLKRMMEKGSYGYSIPSFPGHTPSNFATLLTGSTPKVHGVTDGPMHIEGYPLSMVSKGGFSSSSKLVEPISYTLEARNYLVSVLSVPGTTPPELEKGITLKGRWGGWGVDFPALLFQSELGSPSQDNNEHRVFYSGPELSQLGRTSKPSDWNLKPPQSYSPPQEVKLSQWSQNIYGYIYDSHNDQKTEYDRILLSKDKQALLADLGVGEWTDWTPVSLKYEMLNDYNINTPKKKEWESSLSSIEIEAKVKIKAIKLGKSGFYRLRFYYDSLNEFSIQPSDWYAPTNEALGPMVDFPDSYPAQLIHFDEDKDAFLDEANMSLAWHKSLAGFAIDKMRSNIVIHNIYTPNQMLTSRWWMGFVDPKSRRFSDKPESERKLLMGEVKAMYKKIDEILGEVLDRADDNTVVVFGSDHGIVAFNREVRLNNLFAQKGWLQFTWDKNSKTYVIDWKKTNVVYLQMDAIYINPQGLAGNYTRAQGAEYEDLRNEVIKALGELKDEDGNQPLDKILKWEQASELDLPTDRVGDLIIANKAGFNWVETLSKEQKVFWDPLPSGYKQAVRSENTMGMWTPFVIMGPGVKQGFEIKNPIRHIQQYPTIMKLLKEEPPSFVEGRPLEEIFN